MVVRSWSSLNLLDDVGAIHGEFRHSDLLAFLLSPARKHRLGSLALLRVLRALLPKLPAEERPITVLSLMVDDIGDVRGT